MMIVALQMLIEINLKKLTLCLNVLHCFLHRIYVVHDEVKDKNFELELSWIGEGIMSFVDLSHAHWAQQARAPNN